MQQTLGLDYLFIDTHPGVNEETLLSIAVSDTLLIVLRTDHQDYQGTAVTVDLARRLETPRILLVVNKVLPPFDAAAVGAQIGSTYDVPVAGVIPLSEDLVRLASNGVFALAHPDPRRHRRPAQGRGADSVSAAHRGRCARQTTASPA